MPIEEEYKGRGSSGRRGSYGSRGRRTSRTPKIKTKYDISAEEAKKLSPSEKLKYDEYHKNSSYASWMFLLVVLLVIFGIIVAYFLYDTLPPGKYFKYDQYVIPGSIASTFWTAAYFANVSVDKAFARMKELLKEDPATASDEEKKLATAPPAVPK